MFNISDMKALQNQTAGHVNAGAEPSRRFSVAPMMDWTTPHYRYMARQLSKHALLYTEMVTTGALIHGDTERFLHHNAAEYPLALQLGGSNTDELAHCADLAQRFGFSEVNLNVEIGRASCRERV